jgi:signal transduction histidine kinase
VIRRFVAEAHRRAQVATAAVVFAVILLTTSAGPNGGALDAIAVTLAGIASGVLVAARRYPLTVLLISSVAAEAYLVYFGGHHGEMVVLAPLWALYTVADTSPRWRSLLIGCLAVLTFAALHIMIKPASPLGAENLALAALGGLAVAAGDGSRIRRAYQAEVEQRAVRAEAEREAEAARRVTEERLRIARDLHDVIGHQLAVIHVQAGVAARVPTQEARNEALEHIRTASKEALEELSDTVSLLREREPVRGLAGLDDLITSFRRSGMTIVDHVSGEVRALSPSVDLTAYRLIQEALTNACKHAGPAARVELTLRYQDDAFEIVVHNGSSKESASEGHGIAGMRERVAALGGRLSAGPTNGGFRVSAFLPAGAAS